MTVKWCGEDHPHNGHLWAQDNRVEIPDFGTVEPRKIPGAQPPYLLADCPGSTGADAVILDLHDGDTLVLRYAQRLTQDRAEAIIQAVKGRLFDRLPYLKVLVMDMAPELNVIRKADGAA